MFVTKAIEINPPFIKCYLDLERENTSPGSCLVNLETEFKEKWRSSFEAAHNDDDRPLGSYFKVNPSLSKPSYHSQLLLETDRLLLSRFRCGSHSLSSLKLVDFTIFQEMNVVVRAIWEYNQYFRDCPLTQPLLVRNYNDLYEVFQDDNICILLHKICNRLNISL